jgi:hypothetical protein
VPELKILQKTSDIFKYCRMRRFPAPWTVEALDGGFKIVDANGQVLAYVYGLDDSRDARIANSLTRDEARRIASNIAKLPDLLGKR